MRQYRPNPCAQGVFLFMGDTEKKNTRRLYALCRRQRVPICFITFPEKKELNDEKDSPLHTWGKDNSGSCNKKYKSPEKGMS